ncbi:type II secretion system protein GspL [uncultured Desulfuromusa sp.]|uniref:type II secretion system protein GspL n=1 Tax=uncultured Desulfuromusa sp. TaxID=219183 RepID=UPI002AA89EC3|nr:type II secretion system protein GspL [uncultured Desulfuromusa sp.]
MKKRFLGLDIGSTSCYLTLLEYEKNELKAVRFYSSKGDELADQLIELYDHVDRHLGISDRVAAALPAKTAYVRKLELPFRDSKKIMAAIPFSLSSQIPVSIDDCLTSAIINNKSTKDLSHVTAAAIPRDRVEKVLSSAAEAEMPLHILDLPPFSLMPLVAQKTQDAILITINSQETLISFIRSGQLEDYQLLPKQIQPAAKGDIQNISRAIKTLTAHDKDMNLPVLIVGDGDIETLATHLNDIGYDAQELALNLAGEIVPPAYFHATSLAFRASGAKEQKSFNFRSGIYALKGEWQKLKRALWLTAALTIISALVVTTTAMIQYRTRVNQLDILQKEMTQLFQQTFSTQTVIVDIPLQMKSSIRQLREKMNFIGGSQPQILPLLKLLSDATENVAFAVEELTIGSNEVKVSGSAPSFDAINKVTEQLETSALIQKAQVAEAQMALKGEKINFRLILDLVPN